MPLPYLLIGGQKVAIFKNIQYYYGPLINTTPANQYSIKQEITVNDEPFSFTWPSAEQAYHAQKIIHLKRELAKKGLPTSLQKPLTQVLWDIHNATVPNAEFLPARYAALVTQLIQTYPQLGPDKQAFDALCDADFHKSVPTRGINPDTGKPYTLEFMRTVVRLKLEQHDELRATVMQMAREGILPIEISNKDLNWASGPDGSGLGMLGIVYLEEGNRLLQEQRECVVIPSPEQCYSVLQKRAQAQIAYNALKDMQPESDPRPVTQELIGGHWVINSNKTRAAFVHNGAIVTGVYFDQGVWLRGGNLARFNDMVAFPPSTYFDTSNPQGQWIYNNPNTQLATRAALCQNGVVVTGIFRSEVTSPWQQSGALSRFQDLIPVSPMPIVPIPFVRTPVVPIKITSPRPDVLDSVKSPALNVPERRVPPIILPDAFSSKKHLLQQLRLDSDNLKDMRYWQQQVKSGGASFKQYKLPHTIVNALNYIALHNELPYEQFKKGLENVLKEKSGSLSSLLGLQGLFRSKAVQDLRTKAQEGTLDTFLPRYI